MKRKMHILAIIIMILPSLCSLGYGYDSILVQDDESKVVLSTRAESKDTQLLDFLQENKINTVNDYAQWLEKNIHYEKVSINEEWTAWQETLARGYGDCKNLSALNTKVLEILGYAPVLIGYKDEPEGHLFTTFMKDGVLNIFDNTKYYVTKLTTIDQVSMVIYQKYNVESIFEVTLNPWSVELLYTRAMLAKLTEGKQTLQIGL